MSQDQSGDKDHSAPSMSKYASQADYWKARAENAEAALEQVTAQRDAAERDVASAELHRAGRIPELEQTRINADYWLNEARGKESEGRGDWLICAEQAVNAWKNAAYAAWDKLRSTESASGDRK